MPLRYEFGPLTVLAAQAFGEPGQRTFRVVAGDRSQLVGIWMEKEQLKALADAIDELLIRMRGTESAESIVRERPAAPQAADIPDPEVEFQVGQLSLGFDRDMDLFVLLAWDIDDVDEEDSTFMGRATREQLRTLSKAIGEIYVAGRPKCALCGLPLDPTARRRGEMDHHCLRRNGHYKVAIE